MFTVSWRFSPEGYDLFFNRDEQRSRPEGFAPALRIGANDQKVLAPTDPKEGGSWIFLNEHRLCAVVLNYYGSSENGNIEGARSRGRLLIDLAAARNREKLAETLQQAVHKNTYNPFVILVMDFELGPRAWCWTGEHLSTPALPKFPMLTTSSYRTRFIENARVKSFEKSSDTPANPSLEALRAFHFRHDPQSPAVSPLMERPDARTVSVTRVSVCSGEVVMHYLKVADAHPPEARFCQRSSLLFHAHSRPI